MLFELNRFFFVGFGFVGYNNYLPNIFEIFYGFKRMPDARDFSSEGYLLQLKVVQVFNIIAMICLKAKYLLRLYYKLWLPPN